MTHLRTTIAASIAVLCFAVTPAMAQEAGSFAGKFKKVVDNCEAGLSLEKATLAITKDGKAIRVRIDGLPVLNGKADSRGKLRAKAKGSANGLEVRYGLNGRVANGKLQAVFVAEYFKGEKPVCTQSFRVMGTRSR